MRREPTARTHARRLVIIATGPRVFVICAGADTKGGSASSSVRAERVRDVVLHTLRRAVPHVVGDVSVLLTDDEHICRLNRRFRAVNKPTDVLAFPLGDGVAEGEPFGDVVVSCQTARRQARSYGATLGDEISRLLVHGALHLCGYDHHERKEAARMFAFSRRLLAELRAKSRGTRTASRRAPRRKSRRREKDHRPASKRHSTVHA